MTDEEMAEEYTAKNGFGSDCNNLTSYDANKEIEQAFLAGLKAGRPPRKEFPLFQPVIKWCEIPTFDKE